MNVQTYQTTGSLLKEVRHLTGMNQKQAARKCEVSFSAVEKWEREAPIKRPMLIGILMILNAPSELIQYARTIEL